MKLFVSSTEKHMDRNRKQQSTLLSLIVNCYLKRLKCCSFMWKAAMHEGKTVAIYILVIIPSSHFITC